MGASPASVVDPALMSSLRLEGLCRVRAKSPFSIDGGTIGALLNLENAPNVPFQSSRLLCIPLILMEIALCNGRGRGFEPRRPRHTKQNLASYGTSCDKRIRVRLGSLRAGGYPKRGSSNLSLTRAGHHHPYNLALCGSFMRVHGLRVHVERDPAARVPYGLLYRPKILLSCFSNVMKRIAEGLPIFLCRSRCRLRSSGSSLTRP